MTRLVLKRPHTHAGASHARGDRIEVDASTADWLLAHDIAAPEPSAPKADTESKPIPRKEPKA